MSILYWNCQGLGPTLTVDSLKDCCIQFGPSMVCLLETKNQDGNFHRLLRRLNFPHHAFVKADGFFGGILVMWKEDFEISFLSKSHNFINIIGTFNNQLAVFPLCMEI